MRSLASMQRLVRIDEPACLAAAALLEGTRLIDNLLFFPAGGEGARAPAARPR